jgi:serine O-acetyltransferase
MAKTKANLPYYFYALGNFCHRHHIPFIPFLMRLLIRHIFGAVIPSQATIGKNVHFGYNGLGIVIHHRAVIGNNVHFYSHVVVGGSGGPDVPVIGDNVVIGAGAKILGKVRIGNNVRIGANAVVLTDVPDGATAVGIPARIILKASP